MLLATLPLAEPGPWSHSSTEQHRPLAPSGSRNARISAGRLPASGTPHRSCASCACPPDPPHADPRRFRGSPPSCDYNTAWPSAIMASFRLAAWPGAGYLDLDSIFPSSRAQPRQYIGVHPHGPLLFHRPDRIDCVPRSARTSPTAAECPRCRYVRRAPPASRLDLPRRSRQRWPFGSSSSLTVSFFPHSVFFH